MLFLERRSWREVLVKQWNDRSYLLMLQPVRTCAHVTTIYLLDGLALLFRHKHLSDLVAYNLVPVNFRARHGQLSSEGLERRVRHRLVVLRNRSLQTKDKNTRSFLMNGVREHTRN